MEAKDALAGVVDDERSVTVWIDPALRGGDRLACRDEVHRIAREKGGREIVCGSSTRDKVSVTMRKHATR